MKKILNFFSVFLLFSSPSLNGQNFFPISIEGHVDGRNLENAFSGGLNSPQFNSLDFNNDGEQDLCVFDRTGNVVLPFFWENGRWQHHPEYASSLPRIKEWLILRDYNGDGIQDLFSYSDVPGIDGIIAYKGFYKNDTIAFQRVEFEQAFNIIFFQLPSGGRTNLRVTKIDYPAIDDIDCDGDLDILTFNVGGGQIELFQNQSVELGYGTDTLIYKLVDFCWGGIFETGFTEEIDLASTPGTCATPAGPNVEFRHAGSTILTMDIDNDGDKDAILGDLSFDNLNLLHNAGDCDQAWIDRQDVDFPSNSKSVDIFSFPASFWLDVDRDGVKDLIAAPSLLRGGENKKVAWRYKNTASNELPEFVFQQDDFLVGQMFDLGSEAHPTFADVNQDGLPDMVVGSAGFFDDFEVTSSGLFLFLNTGTSDQPQFELVDSNYLNMRQFNPLSYNFSPAFGDLDNDGDLDLIVGEESGSLFFARNIAGPGRPFRFDAWQYPFQEINVGLSSKPQLVDLNEDGLLDLVVGERNGNINYFQNAGSPENPIFHPEPESAPNTFFLGQVDTRRPGFIIGSSHPFFFKGDDQWKLITGTENSGLEVYEGVEGQFYDAFTYNDILSDLYGLGFKTSPAVADINSDGLLELVVGNERGGFSFWSTPWRADQTTSIDDPLVAQLVNVYPNPASDWLWMQFSEKMSSEIWKISLFNVNGQEVKQMMAQGNLVSMDIQGLAPGIYFIRIWNGDFSLSRKLLIQP